MMASDSILWNLSVLDDDYSTFVPALSNDHNSYPASEIEWSFDILGEISDYKNNLNEDIIVFSTPGVETNIPIVNTPSFVFTSDQCTTSSETNDELDLDNYPDNKVFKNHEDFMCKLSHSFEYPFQKTMVFIPCAFHHKSPFNLLRIAISSLYPVLLSFFSFKIARLLAVRVALLGTATDLSTIS